MYDIFSRFQIVFEAYVRLLDNGQTAIGETVTVTTAMRTFLDTVEIATVDFIASDPDTFVDRVIDSVSLLLRILTLILLETKVTSLCHQYRARPACTFLQSDQVYTYG